jgi:MGC89869 protein
LKAELKVKQEHTNSSDTLHGGLVATLIDRLSTLALESKFIHKEHDKWPHSVSVNLEISFLNPVQVDDTVLIHCSTLKMGKTLAHLDVNVINKCDGKLIAKGKHIKFIFYD